jgi:hypothetical protein
MSYNKPERIVEKDKVQKFYDYIDNGWPPKGAIEYLFTLEEITMVLIYLADRLVDPDSSDSWINVITNEYTLLQENKIL